jgi:single-stranded-DNA-specific exonuclease
MTAPLRPRPVDPVRAAALGGELGLGATIAQVLLHRGADDAAKAAAFLAPRLRDLADPRSMSGLEAAIERIASAIRRGERIVVFGDYDVDGTTSAAILALAVEAFGGDVRALVAHRFEGGYGLSDLALERCLSLSPSLLVTCDCGSSDHERVAKASARGVDVVVIDHHLVPEEALPAVAFLNPHQPGCAFPYKGLASAGLAFVVAARLRHLFAPQFDVKELLDLVALGTIADVAPLDGDNRRLVRAGLEQLERTGRPGLKALMKLAGMRSGRSVGGRDVSFRLAPRLNAAGRLGDPAVTLALLMERDELRARARAEDIEAKNRRRRVIEAEVTAQAVAEVLRVYGEAPPHGVVVDGSDWHHGVLGITAARLVDRFGVPAVVLGHQGDEATGSGRTVDGFDLHRAIARGASELVRFGGHAAAAGLTLSVARIDAFRSIFADATRELPHLGPPPVDVDVEIGGAFELPKVDELRALEPVGEGNPPPRFALPSVVEEARPIGEEGAHLKLRLRVGRRYLSAFCPNHRDVPPSVGARVLAVGELGPDAYRGGDAIELSVHHLLPD